MRLKSWTKKEIKQALAAGKPVFELDTSNEDEDDVLIGTWEQCLEEILDYYEVDDLPENWTLTQIDAV